MEKRLRHVIVTNTFATKLYNYFTLTPWISDIYKGPSILILFSWSLSYIVCPAQHIFFFFFNLRSDYMPKQTYRLLLHVLQLYYVLTNPKSFGCVLQKGSQE